MEAGPERDAPGAEVRRACRHRETPVSVDCIADLDTYLERPARLRRDVQAQRDCVRLVLHRTPAFPAPETMDGVSGLGFGERKLESLALEHVLAVAQAVRPRHQNAARAFGR